MKTEFNDAARLAALLPDVVSIAENAGAILMDFYARYNANPDSIDIEIKEDRSPVTAADKTTSNYIVHALTQLTPGITVVSEENKDIPDNTELFWVVDPLDGTKDFIDRTGGFSVKIALMLNFEPVLGVINAPAFDTTYFSSLKNASWKKAGESSPVTIHTSGSSGQELSILYNRYANPALYTGVKKFFNDHGVAIPETPDFKSGLPRILQVAEGLVDAYPTTGSDPTMKAGGGFIWDTAADKLILENAGGIAIEFLTGKPLQYRSARGKSPSFISFGDKNLGKRLFPE